METKRTLCFEMIADKRFHVDVNKKLKSLSNQIMRRLQQKNSVYFEMGNRFSLKDGDGNIEQKRQKFFVQKTGSPPTWDDVMEAINDVKPASYNFKKLRDFTP